MNPRSTPNMWRRIADWFSERAEQTTLEFLEDAGGPRIRADEGYVRLWLSEGFVTQRRSWGADHVPVMHGGIALRVLGETDAKFTTVSVLPEPTARTGLYLDYQVTPLLPFRGGVIEIEGALYRTSTGGLLAGAATLAGSLKPLLSAPLSTALSMVEKVSECFDQLLKSTDETPLLGVHWSPQGSRTGGSTQTISSGHLILVDAIPGTLKGDLVIEDGRLQLDGPAGRTPPTEHDYLVLRLECVESRDDWYQPELQRLVGSAREAYLHGEMDAYNRYRKEAILRAVNCPEYTIVDQRRFAVLVKEWVDDATQLGASADPELSLSAVAAERMPSAMDPRVMYFSLDEALVSGV